MSDGALPYMRAAISRNRNRARRKGQTARDLAMRSSSSLSSAHAIL